MLLTVHGVHVAVFRHFSTFENNTFDVFCASVTRIRSFVKMYQSCDAMIKDVSKHIKMIRSD